LKAGQALVNTQEGVLHQFARVVLVAHEGECDGERAALVPLDEPAKRAHVPGLGPGDKRTVLLRFSGSLQLDVGRWWRLRIHAGRRDGGHLRRPLRRVLCASSGGMAAHNPTVIRVAAGHEPGRSTVLRHPPGAARASL
jgi:hypothetical protein